MIPSPTELHYFLEVSQTLNMSRAAERLGISQPALSIAIQKLEEAFGQPVFVRGRSGVRLTRAGEKLTVQVRDLIDEWEKIKGEAAKDELEIQGRYTIGCHPSVALYTLPHFLGEILRGNSNLEIKLVHDLSRKITEDVVSFKVDFGIVVNPISHPDLVIKQALEDEVTLWAAPSLKKEVESTLIYDPDLLQTQWILKQLPKSRFKFEKSITSSSLELISELVASGCGVGVLPGRVASRSSVKLRPFGDGAPKFQDKVCIIYRADAQKSKASRVLATKIVSAVAGC